MKKLLPQIGLLFLLLLPLLGRGQEVRISGRVVDAKTQKPVPFTSVFLLEQDIGALTDEAGYFHFEALARPHKDSLDLFPKYVLLFQDSGLQARRQ